MVEVAVLMYVKEVAPLLETVAVEEPVVVAEVQAPMEVQELLPITY